MIASQVELDQLARRLDGVSELALDCEMDSMYAYRTRLCLLQVGLPDGEVLVDGLVDLERSGLGRVFADPQVVKVFHGGENDIGLMRAQWGLEFEGIFDTMAASQVIGDESFSLAAVLQRRFSVALSKKYQKADWRLRPLPGEQAEYARMDVRWLLPLRALLLDDLARLDRADEAQSEFRRIARARVELKPFDPESWVKVRGAREVPAAARGVLKELFTARDALARRRDWAPYRVAQESALLQLAQRQPDSRGGIVRTSGVCRRLEEAELDELLASMARGRELGELPLARNPRPWTQQLPGSPLTDEQQALFDRLRRWRSERAETRGVQVARVATNALLAAIARRGPRTLEELAGVEGMEPWRTREYGVEILDIGAGKDGAA